MIKKHYLMLNSIKCLLTLLGKIIDFLCKLIEIVDLKELNVLELIILSY